MWIFRAFLSSFLSTISTPGYSTTKQWRFKSLTSSNYCICNAGRNSCNTYFLKSASLRKKIIFYLKVEYILHCQDYVTWFDRRVIPAKITKSMSQQVWKNPWKFLQSTVSLKNEKIQNCNFLALSPQVLYSMTRMWLRSVDVRWHFFLAISNGYKSKRN